jgi:hypothetical protein
MSKEPSWWTKPGQIHDSNGYPIYPGDLLRSYHFRGKRNKTYYLYHVAVFVNGYMEFVPTSHLQPEEVKDGGRGMLGQNYEGHFTIINGHGPEPYLSYEDRPRNQVKAEL